MRNQRKILVLLASVLIAGGAVLWFTREKEPAYEGRTLSEWVTLYSARRGKPNQESGEAIRHIGTNALPWLLAWMDYEPPGWKKKLRESSKKLSQSIAQSRPVIWLLATADSETRATQASAAFTALGPIAAPAIPELTRRIHLATTARKVRLMRALTSIGPAAVPAIADILSQFAQEDIMFFSICISIRQMGTSARPLVPLLVPKLQSTNSNVAIIVAETLGQLKSDPELVVPALIKGLDNPRKEVRVEMLMALGQFGESARPALPALTNALNDPDPIVQKLNANTISRITTAPGTNAPPR